MPVTIEENIEPEKVGIVIGSKGSTIMEIMKKSGAKVVINQEFPKGQPHRIIYSGTSFISICEQLTLVVIHSRHDKLSLAGQKDQVDVAKSLVLAVMTKGPSGVAEYGNSQTVEVGFCHCGYSLATSLHP